MCLDAIRRETGAGFPVGVRLSMFDGVPFEEGPDGGDTGSPAVLLPRLKGRGRPVKYPLPYLWGFGVDEKNPLVPDPREPLGLIGTLLARGVKMFNLTCGCPYANPHLSRPTETPPVDAYQPPRDPLHEVAVHFSLAAAAKLAHPAADIAGTGYSYLRGFKFHAAEHNLSQGRVDVAGLGRALLSYPDEIRHVLEGGKTEQGRGRVVCTGDSSCTTAPRLGLKSGCVYDPYYYDVMREVNARMATMGLKRA
jgi:2,4-dienoyl-CoA reductase-like NADH-dependent reductase (Old Yellow Enzyme family)